MSENKPPADPRGGGFLSRWSRRKDEARQGLPLAEPPSEPAAESGPSSTAAPVASAPLQTQPPPPLTLADVQALSAESDFAPFMGRGVAAAVRNAAMKKLFFSDPHYNVMDGLDIYIDDYSKTTPLSQAMLKSMASAKFLGLFDDAEQEADTVAATDCGAAPLLPAQPTGALAAATTASAEDNATDHEPPASAAPEPDRTAALLNHHDEKNPDL